MEKLYFCQFTYGYGRVYLRLYEVEYVDKIFNYLRRDVQLVRRVIDSHATRWEIGTELSDVPAQLLYKYAAAVHTIIKTIFKIDREIYSKMVL